MPKLCLFFFYYFVMVHQIKILIKYKHFLKINSVKLFVSFKPSNVDLSYLSHGTQLFPLCPSPFSFLLQEVCEVIALIHVVNMFVFLYFQLMDGAAVTLFSQQQLTQHPPVCVLVLLLQTFQLRHEHKAGYERTVISFKSGENSY